MSENQKCPVSTDLTQNIEEMEFYFHDCADIKNEADEAWQESGYRLLSDLY